MRSWSDNFKSLDSYEDKIEILSQKDGLSIGIPYHLSSDGIQRIIFYLAAMRSNRSSVIIFEEPEANVFPFYVSTLAESIALDENQNQYFVATHNPYFLLSVLEKTPKSDIRVFVCVLHDGVTGVVHLTDDELQEVMELEHSVFHNLDRFVRKERHA